MISMKPLIVSLGLVVALGAVTSGSVKGISSPKVYAWAMPCEEPGSSVTCPNTQTGTCAYDTSDNDPGALSDADDTCPPKAPEPLDVCPNIEGTQQEVPAGLTLKDGQCVDKPIVVSPPIVVPPPDIPAPAIPSPFSAPVPGFGGK